MDIEDLNADLSYHEREAEKIRQKLESKAREAAEKAGRIAFGNGKKRHAPLRWIGEILDTQRMAYWYLGWDKANLTTNTDG